MNWLFIFMIEIMEIYLVYCFSYFSKYYLTLLGYNKKIFKKLYRLKAPNVLI
jgi:hypothetical protein